MNCNVIVHTLLSLKFFILSQIFGKSTHYKLSRQMQVFLGKSEEIAQAYLVTKRSNEELRILEVEMTAVI